MPIRQFLYFDAIECLPENVFQTPSSEANTTDSQHIPQLPNKQSRYYSQELVFGHEFQQKLLNSEYFVVSHRSLHRRTEEHLSLSLLLRSVQVPLAVKC